MPQQIPSIWYNATNLLSLSRKTEPTEKESNGIVKDQTRKIHQARVFVQHSQGKSVLILGLAAQVLADHGLVELILVFEQVPRHVRGIVRVNVVAFGRVRNARGRLSVEAQDSFRLFGSAFLFGAVNLDQTLLASGGGG